MASTVYEGKECRYGVADQAISGTFGTAVADDANYIEVGVEHFDIDRGIIIHEVAGAHGTKNPTKENTVHSTLGAMAGFTSAGPFNLSVAAHYLYTHFQKVTEADGTPFAKTFTFFTTQPGFSDDAGHWLTWCRRFPVASQSHKVHSCIAKTTKLSAERDGMLMQEHEWCSRDAGVVDANPSGAWVPTPNANILYFNEIASATIDYGAGAQTIILQSFEVNTGYDIEKLGQNAAGYDTYGCKDRAGSFTITLMKDTQVESALAALAEDTFITFVVTWTDKLIINVTGKVEGVAINADGVLGATLTCKMLAESTTAEPSTLVVSDLVDRGW